MREKIIEILVDILEREDDLVLVEDTFRDYEEWDSLSVLSLLAMINEEFDLVIPRKEFDNMVTVKDILCFIEKTYKV